MDGNPILAEFSGRFRRPSAQVARSLLRDLDDGEVNGHDATLNATAEQVEEARSILAHLATLGDRAVILKLLSSAAETSLRRTPTRNRGGTRTAPGRT